MFYVLSKILDVALTPIAWATVLIVAALAARSPTRARRAVGLLGVAILLAFSLEPVSNALFATLEDGAPQTMKPGVTYDVVILLGGLADDRPGASWKTRAYNDNNERLLEVFDLLRAGKATNAILSAGPPPGIPGDFVEARVLGRQLTDWGIDRSRLVLDEKARNTHENAVYSSEIVRAHGWKRVLVVTSAYHMPRALGCFRAEGLDVDADSVDFRSFAHGFAADALPRADHLSDSSAALREWAGRVVYRLRGYSR